jgi:hypothetical protein
VCNVSPANSPPGTEGNPIVINSVLGGDGLTCPVLPITETGTIPALTPGQAAPMTWYAFNVSAAIINNCEIQGAVSPAADPALGTPGAGIDVYFANSTFTSATLEVRGTKFHITSGAQTPTGVNIEVAVRWIPALAGGSYTLTLSAVPCPCYGGGI